ncbi:GGDEF domain-containing protein [Terriglobus aquaticus]|uniref:diguanylate cyclase n=1 Tax=Terriglobus aquaticus TaxID=940139 RepID=A0ABW9KIS7_9BACT|nr:GGDEF domain-containing protein [Terriglobus aquaticus]
MQPRTTAREVHLLNPSEAAEAEPVHLTGVVTVSGGWKNSFFLEDVTGGIAVNRAPGGPELRPGDRVAVDGVTSPGDFAPTVNRASVRVLGHGPLPVPSHMHAADLGWGGQDSEWVEVEGEVRAVERKVLAEHLTVRLLLNMGAGEPTPVRVVAPEPNFAWESFTGATIRMRAVCATIWNKRRQFAGIRFITTSRADFVVTHAAPADPYDVPFRPIAGLAQYSHATRNAGQVEVQGTVTLVEPHRGFFLQDGSGAAFVVDKQEQPALNTTVVVVGFPAVTGGVPTLLASRFQRVGTGTVTPRALRSATEVVARSDDAESTACDGMLLQTAGTLVDFTPGLHDATLFLKSDNLLFRAYLPMQASRTIPWQRGSVLQLRGVCEATGDDTDTEGFLLRLRSQEDVTLLQRAPWWTAMHALWLSGALGATALGMLAWVAFLRRQAHLRKLISIDALTGLYNRRAFLLLAEKQMEIMRRRKSALLLFYFDVDNFKHINDTYGHRAGDAALKDVAALLRQVFRESDTVCRMGGDEFAALVRNVTPESEATLRERLTDLLRIDNQRGQRPFRIALSVGAVYYDHTCANRSIEDVLEHADALMYGNKRQRREAKMMPLAV